MFAHLNCLRPYPTPIAIRFTVLTGNSVCQSMLRVLLVLMVTMGTALPLHADPATVSLSGLDAVYDGTPKSVTVTTNPVGLIVDITYNGSPTPPTDAGNYAVIATVSDPNYQGSASGTLVISPASQNAPVISSGSTVALGVSYTATCTPGGDGLIEWALGTGSTASDAAIMPLGGTTRFSSTGTLVIRARLTGGSNYLASPYSPDFTLTISKATSSPVLGTLVASSDGTANNVISANNAVVTTIAGGYPTWLETLGCPSDVGLDAAGNVYFVDIATHVIGKISTSGNLSTLAGTAGASGSADGTGGAARFSGPHGIAVDDAGNVYVADAGNHTIRKITPGGVVSTLAGMAGEGGFADGTGNAARFREPTDVAVDGSGNLYVADCLNSAIRKISPAGVVTTVAGGGLEGSADGLSSQATFRYPRGLALDGTGNIYVADTSNSSIRKISTSGVVTTVAGSAGTLGSGDGVASAARFRYPWSVAVDGTGNLYVSDTANSTIRRITPTGLVTTVAGSVGSDDASSVDGQGSIARFRNPAGLAVGGSGNLYVADINGNSVRKITIPSDSVTVTYDGSATLPTAPGSYAVVATRNDANYQGSTLDTLVITDLPVITSQSATRNVLRPSFSLTLSVTAASTGTPSYQWYHDGRIVSGANASNLSLTNATYADTGAYWVAVTNESGTTRSAPMFVTVAPRLSQIVAWGSNSASQTSPPDPAQGENIAIAAGDNHALALDRNGTVVAWGDNSLGQRTVPVGLTDVVSVAAGGNHSLALKSDGTVVSWGEYYWNGQVAVPPGLTDVVAIADGGNRSMALKADGTLVVWGYVGGGTPQTPLLPAGLSGVFGMTNGGLFSLARKSDQTVVGWMSSDGLIAESIVPAGLSGVTGLSTQATHSMALKSDGTVVDWGTFFSGMANTPANVTDVVAISAGPDHSLALQSDGTVRAWGGYNAFGQATLPAGLANVFALSAGSNFSVALRDASSDIPPIINTHPASQTKTEEQTATFTVLAYGGDAPLSYQWFRNSVAIAGATSASLVLNNLRLADGGTYEVVVTNYLGSATSNAATLTVHPVPVVTDLSPTRHVLAPGQALNLSVTASGSSLLTYQWIHNGQPISEATTNSYSIPATLPEDSGWYAVDVTDIYATTRSVPMFVIVSPAMTQVRGWGTNDHGEISIPAGLTDAVALAGGDKFALALKANGTVVAWGNNTLGRTDVPAGLAGVVAIAAGHSHSLALNSNGTVVAWGDGGNVHTTVPAGLKNVVAIAAGVNNSLALKADGTVVAWGFNGLGESSVPAGLTGVVAVAAGQSHSLALKGDGTVVAWGSNYRGERDVPAYVTGVVAIAAGWQYSLALKSDGSVVSWGRDLGSNPVPAGLNNASGIAAGGYHGLALRSDGIAAGWVYDASSGNVEAATPPIDLAQVFEITGGNRFSIAVRDASGDTVPIITAQPVNQTLTEGENAVFSVIANGGTAPLAYQWRKNGSPIAGAISATLNLTNLVLSDAGDYDVVVTSFIGTTNSVSGTLAVNPLPVISELSASRQILTPGGTLHLSVGASGTGAVSYQWTRNGHTIPGATSNVFSHTNVSFQDNGWYTVLVTDSHGTRRSSAIFVKVAPLVSQVIAWGYNEYGSTSVPAGLTQAVAVAVNYDHGSFVIRGNGDVVSWGSNFHGELVPPAGLNSVVAIAAASSHTLALKSDGTVTGWGNSGSLGVIPPGLNNVIAIGADGYMSYALKADGTVVGWGSSSSVPAQATGLVDISVGGGYVLGLKMDGTLISWGSNSIGSMVVPANLNNVAAISAGTGYALALKVDGTVVAWGYEGQPISPPAGLTGVIAISAGNSHALALKHDGTIVSWGTNTFGETSIPYSSNGYVAIAAGNFVSLGLRNATGDTAPVISAHPDNPTNFIGDSATLYVTASGGTAQLTYQWRKGGVNISGATAPRLVLSNLVPTDVGDYDVVVSNYLGSVTSNTATLTVNRIPTTFALSATSFTYTGAAQGPTMNATPSNATFSTGGTLSAANAGSYTATATATGNYSGSNTALTWTIAKATPSVTWNPPATITFGTSLDSTQLNATAGIPGTFTYVPAAGSLLGAGVHSLTATFTPADVDNYAVVVTERALLVLDSAGTGKGADFDGDGADDILWTNSVTGERAMWLMDGTVLSGGAVFGTVPVEWEMSAAADYNGDGTADIFWTNASTGDRAMWLMDGTTVLANAFLSTVPVEWKVSGTGDFNGDGKCDILWTNTTTGDRAMWLMNGSTVLGGGFLTTLPLEWQVAGTGDHNGDGKADILWSNTVTGERAMWLMNGVTVTDGAVIGTVPVSWAISASGDYDGDGNADIFWTNTTTGDRAMWLMNGTVVIDNAFLSTVPIAWKVSGAGDYNGDGKADVLWTNTMTGDRAMWLMSGSTVLGGGFLTTVPLEWAAK